jgi:hypothetical protein
MKPFIPRWLVPALIGLLLVAPVPASNAADEEVAGAVVRLLGSAVAMQDAAPRPLKVGDKVLRGDVISTGRGTRLEMKMLDDAVMTLGERAVFVVLDYVTTGAQPNAAVRILEGAFSAATGKLMTVAGARFTVETETATIGIRGTTFWGGPIDGVFEVALLDGKAIVVENKAGRVVIDKVGDGTAIRAADLAPTTPRQWPADKVARAKATVAFQ